MLDFTRQFETKSVSLRLMVLNDWEGFERATSNAQLWTYFTSDLSDEKELKKWIQASVQDIKKQKRLVLTVLDKKNGELIGSTSLGNISLRDRRIEIGWTWLAKSHQGMGINDEVKTVLLRYCFEELNMQRVEFKTDVLNAPARKALLRIGATEEGILRSHTLMAHGRRRDTIYYSILRDEWIKND